jgi:glycosyl-4,4'-diaponeurosporenoate acyltransferase
VRVIHLSNAATLVLDIVAWALVHAGTGYAVHRIHADSPLIARDQWWSRLRRFERDGGRFYQRVLRIKRWKDRVPEAGALFAGGVSKRRLRTRTTPGLRHFATETRRAELGHWLAAAAGPFFLLWNPWWAAVIIVGYGLAANLPFIAIQRYNRARVARVLERPRAGRPRASG